MHDESTNPSRVALVLLMMLASPMIFASHNATGSPSKPKLNPFLSYVVTLGGGPARSWNLNNNNQTIFLQSDLAQTYAKSNTSQSLATGEIFIGLQRAFNTKFTGQLGLALATISKAHLKGDIWQDADPAFDNFSYQYYANYTRVALKAKLLADIGRIVKPYISASMGVGFNKARDFSITPKLFQQIAPPAFQSSTTTSFSYTLGAGIQKALSKNWHAGLGYEFADWGNNQLARAPGQTINNGLNLPNFYTSSIFFSISYIA